MLGMTCVGVTKLILWQPIFWSWIIILAKSSSSINFPFPSWEMGQFWQKIHRRLQLEKKMVPDPFLPTKDISSDGHCKSRVWPGPGRILFHLFSGLPHNAWGRAGSPPKLHRPVRPSELISPPSPIFHRPVARSPPFFVRRKGRQEKRRACLLRWKNL